MLVCLLPQAQAQDDNLPTLLFEPVVLKVLTTEGVPPNEAPYTVQELSTLPQGTSTDLQTWLAARDTVIIAPPEERAADIAAYQESVLELERTGGAFTPGLDQDLLALGTLLQQDGQLTEAQKAFDRALHVNRVNGGLFSMGQIPIIERTIENHLARGDLVAADEQQEYLFYVQRKNFSNRGLDLLPALTRYAEWNLFAFRARLVPTVTPDPLEVATAEPPPPENSELMLDFRTGRLITAHQIYQSIINILTINFGDADSRLLNFERQLALTNYLYIATFGLEGQVDPVAAFSMSSTLSSTDMIDAAGRPPLGFRQGRDSLQRRVATLESRPDATALELAQAKLDLADWMLLFSKRMGSLEIYQEAWQIMATAGASTAELDVMFNPPVPKEIPEYVDRPYTRESLQIPADLALEYKGYIDVQFKLSRFGVPSGVSITSKSLTATPALESILLRKVRRAEYRPRIVDGMVRDNETMQVRFYFTY